MSSYADLLRIAAQIERWARFDDVMAPGLPDAELLREAAAENQRLREALERAHEACCKPEDDALARLKAANIIVCEALAGDAE